MGTVREMPDADLPRSRWVVRARRHVEGGTAAITLQVRPDGRLALLVTGEGRGGCVLDADATARLASAVASAARVAQGDGQAEPTPVRAAGAFRPRPSPRLAESRVLPGRGPMRVGSRIVVVAEVHVLLCGFAPVRERLAAYPDLMPCSGCDLLVRDPLPRGGGAA